MGKIFKFDKDVDTDQIIASQYLLFPTIDEMKSHTFESLDSDFAKNVKPGDFVVADEYADQVISKEDIAGAVLISDAEAYSAACETAKTRWEEEIAPLLVQ